MIQEILFVYNAKSGLWNVFKDIVHKMTSPETYPCHLCAITFGMKGMNSEWKTFIQSLPYPVVFLHLDELPSDVPEAEYPCSFFRTNKGVYLLLNKEQIQSCRSVPDLIVLVNHALVRAEQR